MRRVVGYMTLTIIFIGLMLFGFFYNKHLEKLRTPDPGFETNQLKFASFILQLNVDIDEYRDTKNLDFLEYDFNLALIAYRRLKDLQEKPLSHNGWRKRLVANKNYGEVLARGYSLNHQTILGEWKNSKPHDQVLTSHKFRSMGVATDGDTVVVILSN